MSDITVRENTSVDVQRNNSPMGFENFDTDIVIVPRAKVMQGLSPELQEDDCDFRMGDIIHSLLLEKLPETFVPITMWNSRTMFVPRSNDKKKAFWDAIGLPESDTMWVCRSLNGKTPDTEVLGFANCGDCPYNKFGWDGNPDTPPLCTHTINCLAVFDGQDMPVVIQFANTNFKNGRKFASMALYGGGAIFSKKYKITSKKEQNEQGVYYTTPVKPAGKPSTEEIALAKKLYEQFSGVAIEVEEENFATDEFEATTDY